jgi:hypothetical protein
MILHSLVDLPARCIWWRVETPSFSKQYLLPELSVDWSLADWRKFRELQDLARRGDGTVRRDPY